MTIDFEPFSPQMHRLSPNAQQTSNAHFQRFTASPDHVKDHPDNRPTWHAAVAQPADTIIAAGDEAILTGWRPEEGA
jgi:hypothetical protein